MVSAARRYFSFSMGHICLRPLLFVYAMNVEVKGQGATGLSGLSRRFFLA
jgi:hypothetical protein